MKICYKCKVEKEISEFSINEKKKDGLNCECKECQKLYFKEYYKKNKEKQKEAVKKHKKRRKIFLAKEKLKSGCVKCGYNSHPAALHFHHKDSSQKSFCISEGHYVCENTLLEELNKCEVLCANCHCIQHSKFKYSDLEIDVAKNTKKRKEKTDKPVISGYERKKKARLYPSKEELESILWEIPTTKIAEKYNVSDKTIQKWCEKYNLKKPPRGYWTKRK